MKELENLRALVYGEELNSYQRELAKQEFEMLLNQSHSVKTEVFICSNCYNNHTNKEYDGYCYPQLF